MCFDRFLLDKIKEEKRDIKKLQSELMQMGFDWIDYNCNCEKEFCICGELSEMLNDKLQNIVVLEKVLELYTALVVMQKKLSEEEFFKLMCEQLVSLALEKNLVFHCMNDYIMRTLTEYRSVRNNI